MNPEIVYLDETTSDGKQRVCVNGTEYELPNEITSVKGIPAEMLLLRLKGYSYAEAFRLGTRLLLGNIESEQDVLKKQIDDLEQSIKADRFQLSVLKEKYDELEGVSQADAAEEAAKFEKVVAEFEKMTKSVGRKKDPAKTRYLAGLHPKLTEELVAQIYKDATPSGSVVPSVDMIRAQVEKYLM